MRNGNHTLLHFLLLHTHIHNREKNLVSLLEKRVDVSRFYSVCWSIYISEQFWTISEKNSINSFTTRSTIISPPGLFLLCFHMVWLKTHCETISNTQTLQIIPCFSYQGIFKSRYTSSYHERVTHTNHLGREVLVLPSLHTLYAIYNSRRYI